MKTLFRAELGSNNKNLATADTDIQQSTHDKMTHTSCHWKPASITHDDQQSNIQEASPND
jgi:hypothetical protein